VTDPLTTTRRPLAQLVFCQGCCCGRTDRGRPEVPVGRLKEVWKGEKLNRSVQLTISGCLGPCDLANVALVITPDGNRWVGGLAGADLYEALIGWARECHRQGRAVALPDGIDALRFERFGARDESS
jgi:cobaltochelatase CobN